MREGFEAIRAVKSIADVNLRHFNMTWFCYSCASSTCKCDRGTSILKNTKAKWQRYTLDISHQKHLPPLPFLFGKISTAELEPAPIRPSMQTAGLSIALLTLERFSRVSSLSMTPWGALSFAVFDKEPPCRHTQGFRYVVSLLPKLSRGQRAMR